MEVLVEGDSIYLEMRIYEGKQATVNRITIVGNDKTSDFVALRVIRTRQKCSQFSLIPRDVPTANESS